MTKKELLDIGMCIMEYHNILYSGIRNLYSDQKNLKFHILSPPRGCVGFFLKKKNIKLIYVPSKVNDLADCFSRLPQGPLLGKN